MKSFLKSALITSTLVLSMVSGAFGAQTKEYKFKYTYAGQKLEIIETSPSWEKSFERAAMKCFKHFSEGKVMSNDKGMDLIDVCANPKS
jgi:hypothetical protein